MCLHEFLMNSWKYKVYNNRKCILFTLHIFYLAIYPYNSLYLNSYCRPQSDPDDNQHQTDEEQYDWLTLNTWQSSTWSLKLQFNAGFSGYFYHFIHDLHMFCMVETNNTTTTTPISNFTNLLRNQHTNYTKQALLP